MTYKGSRHRTDGKDFKKYQNNQTLWDNLEKSKLERDGMRVGQKIEVREKNENLNK